MSRKRVLERDMSSEDTAKDAKPVKALWKRIRRPLAESRFAKAALVGGFAQYLRLVRLTSPAAPGSDAPAHAYGAHAPMIIALWHGQHVMNAAIYPKGVPLTAMVSRSADAELNAKVLEYFGFRTARGSGGRSWSKNVDKGGARALIALKKALDAGSNVCMIADIPNGTPRDAGLGIVLLARLSGRPIVAVAVATSRRKVLDRTWDKMVINLPFGRRSLTVGEPIFVPEDASDVVLEQKRQEVTRSLNETTDRAYALLEKKP